MKLLSVAAVGVSGAAAATQLRRGWHWHDAAAAADADAPSNGDYMDQYIARTHGGSGTGSVWWKKDAVAFVAAASPMLAKVSQHLAETGLPKSTPNRHKIHSQSTLD